MESLLSELLVEYNSAKLAGIRQAEGLNFSQNSLRLLKKLWTGSSEVQKAEICETYIYLLRGIESQPIGLVINLANDALAVSEYLKGSEFSDEIEYLVYNLLLKIQKNSVLGYNEFSSVNEVIEKYKSESLKIDLKDIAERIQEGDQLAMQDLTNILCSFSSARKLFGCVENDFEDIVNSFKSVRSLQIFIQILNFLNTFLIEKFYLIDGKKYKSSYLKYYKVHENAFRMLWRIVAEIAKADILVSQNLIKIIPKFWNIFEEHRAQMVSDIILVIKEIVKARYMDSMQITIKFVYDTFTDPGLDPNMKNYIKSELPEIFQEKGFIFHGNPSISLDALKINHGFPLLISLDSGEKIEIKSLVSAGSILYCAFVIESHDINFSIRSSSSVMVSEKQIKTDSPYETKMTFSKSDIITIEWDNSYSWFNSKSIRYRIVVLKPVDYKNEEPSPACVILDESRLVLLTSNSKIEHLDTEKPFQLIQDFLVKNKKQSLNLLSSFRLSLEDLSCFSYISHGIDIEAAGKYAWNLLQVHTMLIVSNFPCFRFSVVVNGNVIRTCLKGEKGFDQDFSEEISEIYEMIGGELVLFRVNEREFWAEKLKERGIQVSDLDIDIEVLVSDMKNF